MIFGKKSIQRKNDDVDYIRELPANIKYWFIAELLCSLVGFIALLIGGICLWVDK
ncbi:hypothetical protein H238_1208 [Klebsiella pneumoniae UHKPC179]|nr:hypothetical protein CSC13_2452 [Klebsiella pneumoniae]EGF63504.1 hypothetical protein HMPREF9538_02054 [Klebsiella sp. MS 92-3]EPA87942.1 hypothetical protein H237_1144 [Klebsiella pneumoniae UHKPC57]EPO18416.1 hypothetical protein H217_1300 [Klebsiella pneumoniae DMC0799]EPO89048.1 hypothetical protein H238_1208 [Klebsiella pneumoniae UHKPC179]ESB03082.1 hypothetical protein HMPREF1619_00731 [Klebsiella pneumoniae 909957]CDL15295.1 hypothetical protein [Klebsiella pneumoniae IS46]